MLDSAERERLEALQSLAVMDTPAEARFDRVVRLAQRIFEVPMVAIGFIDHDRQWLKSRVGLEAREFDRADALCDHTIRQSEPIVVPDAIADPRFADSPSVVGDPHIRFYAGQALQAPGGQRVGVVCVMDVVPREFSARDRALLGDLAGWLESELALRHDLERANLVQQSLLPHRRPSIEGFDIAGGCVPASQVGGDFFDWFMVGDVLQLTIADVMGKGMGSAIIAASVRAVLRSMSRASRRATDPPNSPRPVVAAAVSAAARGLEPDLEETASFVTMFTARLDAATATLRYVDAGHGLTVLIGADGHLEHLPATDLPIGITSDSTWTEHRLVLRPGDTLMSVSDGILDFFASAAEVLDSAATVVKRTETAQQTVDEIIRFARAHRMNDDVTALVIRRPST